MRNSGAFVLPLGLLILVLGAMGSAQGRSALVDLPVEVEAADDAKTAFVARDKSYSSLYRMGDVDEKYAGTRAFGWSSAEITQNPDDDTFELSEDRKVDVGIPVNDHLSLAKLGTFAAPVWSGRPGIARADAETTGASASAARGPIASAPASRALTVLRPHQAGASNAQALDEPAESPAIDARPIGEPAFARWLGLAVVALALAALLPLFSRIPAARALDHPMRRLLHAAATESPGLTGQALADKAGIDRLLARYHLDRMKRAGVIAVRRLGKRDHYFVPGSCPDVAEAALTVRPLPRRIHEILARGRPMRLSEIAAEAGCSSSHAVYHLTRLREARLVSSETVDGAPVWRSA